MGGTRSSGGSGAGVGAGGPPLPIVGIGSTPETGAPFRIGANGIGTAPEFTGDEDQEFEVEYVLGGQLYRTNELMARSAEDAVRILQDPAEAQHIVSPVRRNLVNPEETFGLKEGEARLILDPATRSPEPDWFRRLE